MDIAPVIKALLSGVLSCAERTGGFNAFYSRVTFTKQDTAGINRLWLMYNRGTAELGEEILPPQVKTVRLGSTRVTLDETPQRGQTQGRIEDGAWVKVLTPACFLPLWAGVPLPEAQARAMIEKYLLAPEHFFGEYPFPVVAYSDREYRADNRWRGPVWMNIAYLMLEVLDGYGYAAQRDQAADRLVAMVTRNVRPYEAFDSRTGQGQGAIDYGWTSAVLLRLPDFRTRQVFEATER